MNEEKFRNYLKQKKKPENTINSYIKRVKTFESYLNAKNPPKELDAITREDIEDFAFVWGKEKKLNAYLYLWGVQYYYLFKGDLNLHKTADEIKEWVQLEKFKL
ncbi:MAG: site-specific integrase [Candidatus Hodarchaeota archaeon]